MTSTPPDTSREPSTFRCPDRRSARGPAFLIPQNGTVALHADSPEQAERAAAKLHAVGFLELAGYLESPEATETLEPVELDELERLVAERTVAVIDVREPYERDAGYIPGSRNIPYRVIGDFADDLAGDGPS